MLSQGVLVHGDFAMSALFVNNNQFEGIIDFGDAFVGDPLVDIAYFRFKEITKEYGEQVYANLLQAYIEMGGMKVTPETERRILFYTIYWGLRRLRHCPDSSLRLKFVEKLTKISTLLVS